MSYKYPDAEYWIHYLDPLDAAYLLLFSETHKNIMSSKIITPGLDRRGKQIYFELDDGDEGEANGIIEELQIGFDDTVWLDISGSFSGYYTRFIPATHWDPPEGGESVLTDVEIDYIYYSSPVEDMLEIEPKMFEGKDYTYRDTLNMAVSVAEEMISTSDNEFKSGILPTNLPKSITDEIDRILIENKTKIAHKKANKSFGL